MILFLDMLNVMSFCSYGNAGCLGGRGPVLSFGHNWYKIISNTLEVHEIVSEEQVGWEEQSHGQRHVYRAEERGQRAGWGVPRMKGQPGEGHRIQRSRQFWEENQEVGQTMMLDQVSCLLNLGGWPVAT